MLMRNREIWWDSLRAFLVIIVINEHVVRAINGVLVNTEVLVSTKNSVMEYILLFSPLQLISNGAAAVSVMFVLSGYLVSRSALQFSDLFSRDIVKLVCRRYLRLALPVVGSLLILFVVSTLGLTNAAGLKAVYVNSFGYNPFDESGVDFLSMLFQGFIGTPFLMDRSHNPVLWVVSIELFASIALLGICALSTNRFVPTKYRRTIGIGIGIILSIVLYREIVIGFGLGYLIAAVEREDSLKLTRNVKFLLMAIMLFAFSFSIKGGENGMFNFIEAGVHQLDLQYIIYSYGGASLVLLLCTSNILQRAFSLPFLAAVGKRSYSILLVHATAMISAGFFVHDVIPLNIDGKFVVFVLTTYFASIFMGSFLYKFVEKPALLPWADRS